MTMRNLLIHGPLLISLSCCSLFSLLSPPVQALSLTDFLEQVRNQKLASHSNEDTQQSGLYTTAEKDLLVSPTFFLNTTYKYDLSQPQQPGVTYTDQKYWNSTAGIRKTTLFGTKIELGYEFDYIMLEGVQFGGINLGSFSLYTSKPYITLTQSLWQNGFGANTKANFNQLDAQGLQKSLNAQYLEENLLIDAESAYWDLVVAREEVKMQRQTVQQAQQVLDWNIRRRRDNLNEVSDLLQAKAAYESDRLDLQKAINRERELAQNFNEMRAVQSSEVNVEVDGELDDLPEISSIKIKDLTAGALRADVKAAEQGMISAIAATKMSIEKDKPQVDLSLTYGRSGQNQAMSAAQGALTYPTTTVGIQMQLPLDFNAVRRAHQGYLYEEMAAEATYQQKLFDEKKDRENLSLKMGEAKQYLKLATQVESAQEDKQKNEHKAFKNGRTTTYQVLTFERDYIQARLTRIKAMADLLKLMAQAKLYENTDKIRTADQRG